MPRTKPTNGIEGAQAMTSVTWSAPRPAMPQRPRDAAHGRTAATMPNASAVVAIAVLSPSSVPSAWRTSVGRSVSAIPRSPTALPVSGRGLPESPATRAYSLASFIEFLKQTRRVWLMVAGTIFGLMAVVTLVTRASEWAKNARERRHEHAVATVTPDVLIARCGQPVGDVTKDVYPIVMRTMSYEPRGNERLVIAFSRTAEQKSDWVFLSMKDESGARNYEGPEGQIAALPCLDARK